MLDAIINIKDSFKQDPFTLNSDENFVKDIINQYNELKLGADTFIEKTDLADDSLKSYFHTVESGNATVSGYASHIDKVNSSLGTTGIKTKIVSAGTKLLNGLLMTLTSIGVSLFISAIAYGIDQIIHKEERLKEKVEKAKETINNLTESFKEQSDTVADTKERYAELAQGVDQLTGKNLTLSTDNYNEFLNLSNQLAELFPTLNRRFDENGNSILDLSGDVDTIVGSLDDLIKKEQELTNQKILSEMSDVWAGYVFDVEKSKSELDEYSKKVEGSLTASSLVSDKDTKIKLKYDDEYDDYVTDSIRQAMHNIGIKNLLPYESIWKGIHTFDFSKLSDEEFEDLKNELGRLGMDYANEVKILQRDIESSNSDIETYLNTWLSGEWAYVKMDSELQNALQEVLYNSDWINNLPDDVDSEDWDQVSRWLEKNYLNAINNIEDEEIKDNLSKLFTVDLSAQDKLDLANKLQNYFNDNDIKISLDFIIDGDNQNSTQNLVNQMINSRSQIAPYNTEDYNRLKEYTKDFKESQINAWLEATDGASSATEAILKYEQYVQRASSEDVDFFTDDNLEAIDEYKSKISDLATYLESINDDHILTSDELSTLNTEYGIIADSVKEYKEAIIELMDETASNSEVMNDLAEAIESCNDAATKERLQALYDTLKGINTEAQASADSFGDLSTAITSLQSKADLLRDINDSVNEIGYIDSSKLDDIVSTYPQLINMVAQFNAGLITSAELFAALEEAYEIDRHNYEELIVEKLKYDEQFYNNIVNTLPEWLSSLAETYGIDLSNFKNLCEAKLALEKEMTKKMAQLESARISMQNIGDNNSFNDSAGVALEDSLNGDTESQVKSNYLKAKKEASEIQSIINSIDDISVNLSSSIDLDWKTFGKDLASDKTSNNSSGSDTNDSDNSTTEIDWADQSLKVLEQAVDDTQTALEDTHGFDNQIDAIDDLNQALKKLKKGYKAVRNEYANRYNSYIGQLKNGNTIKSYIESGKEFSLKEYDSDTAEIIQNAMDAYNNMVEIDSKIKDTQKQINDNNKLETSKIQQEKYETKLEGIQTDLDNDNLTATEKNSLLKEQLKYQNKINEELIKQAEYEGDVLDVENLKKENKKNERDTVSEKLQNKIDENQSFIDAKNTLLESDDLTEFEIDDIYNTLEDLTESDYKYKFKQIINQLDVDNIWTDYINNLKKQYKQEDVSNKKFIKEHLQEIAEHFSYIGMEELYYEFMNSMDEFADSEYDNHKNTRSYSISANNNKITNIQSDIDYTGGRGTKEQYSEIQSLHQANLDYWFAQKEEAQGFLDAQEEGSAGWDKWNSEVQECQENIDDCYQSIKDCNTEILKLPLNDIEEKLDDISDKLEEISDWTNEYNTYISAATFILDHQIKTQESYKESIQDEIDYLQEANELRQINLELQQAEYNLEKLRNQKTEKVFKEGVGWVYEADQDELRNAQEAYDEAVYNKKIYDLNEQIKVHDEEIERLNEISEKWSEITTTAQGLVDLSKALSYDANFVNKVLADDLELFNGIANNMNALYVAQSTVEEEQEKYQDLQEAINDIIETYELQEVSYEQAQQQIYNALQAHYPELIAKYNTETDKIQEVIDKNIENSDTTTSTSKGIVETVTESNEKILSSYDVLQEDLSEVFGKLNLMLEEFSKNAQNMANTISSAILQVQNELNTLSTTNTTVSVTSSNNENKATVKKAGKSHSGLELGYIGEGNLSNDKKDFQYIALSELSDDEVVRVLQKSEGVITENQVVRIMDNFRKIAQFKTPSIIPLNNASQNKNISFNGDIIIQNAQNASSLAKVIKTQLPNAMLQELYK